jgi:hypothetical protein
MEKKTKLSSITYLFDKFVMIQWLLVRDEISKEDADELLKSFGAEATKIHKEEIENAATWGMLFDSAEQYYKETYKKES